MPCLSISTGSPRRLPPIPTSRRAVRAFGVVALLLTAAASAQVSPLAPERAFRFSARALDPHTVEARFNIADGYYLYRDKLRFSVEPAASGLAMPPLPAGKVKEDQFFGRVETYRGSVTVNLRLDATVPGQKVMVQAESQGCADLGICYPPNIQRVSVALPAAGSAPARADEPPRKQWFQ